MSFYQQSIKVFKRAMFSTLILLYIALTKYTRVCVTSVELIFRNINSPGAREIEQLLFSARF